MTLDGVTVASSVIRWWDATLGGAAWELVPSVGVMNLLGLRGVLWCFVFSTWRWSGLSLAGVRGSFVNAGFSLWLGASWQPDGVSWWRHGFSTAVIFFPPQGEAMLELQCWSSSGEPLGRIREHKHTKSFLPMFSKSTKIFWKLFSVKKISPWKRLVRYNLCKVRYFSKSPTILLLPVAPVKRGVIQVGQAAELMRSKTSSCKDLRWQAGSSVFHMVSCNIWHHSMSSIHVYHSWTCILDTCRIKFVSRTSVSWVRKNGVCMFK